MTDILSARRRHRPRRGLTLIEAMLLLVILSIVAVAAGVGLQAVAKVPAKTDQIMAVNNAIVDTMEQWKAKAWASMASTTDTQTVNGFSYSRTVTVADADPSNPETGTSTKTDFRRITVTYTPVINGTGSTQLSQSMRCYVTQP